MMIKVKVKPGSKEESIDKVSGDEYEVCVRERAKDGKANKKLVNLLAREFKVDWRAIKIKNPRSREKIVEIKK